MGSGTVLFCPRRFCRYSVTEMQGESPTLQGGDESDTTLTGGAFSSAVEADTPTLEVGEEADT